MASTQQLVRREIKLLGRKFDRSKFIRVLVVIVILGVASWIFVALFGPGPHYRLTQMPSAPIDSNQFVIELEAMTGSRVSRGNLVEPLPNGDVFYEAELQAIRAARSTINMEVYIFQRGEIAQRILEALTERARAGVQVRLTVDAMGSFTTPRRYFKALREAGGKMEFYHPLRWNTWMRSNNRTHRELLIIDSEVAFVGGAGIADHWYKSTEDEPRWRDSMFRIRGDAVRTLQGTFLENWLETSGELISGETFFRELPGSGNSTALVVQSSPASGGSTSARVLFQTLLGSAKREIEVTTPYFLPDETLRDEVIMARQRGVRVRIIVPGGKSDHMMTRSSSRRVYGPLLLAGCEIYEFQPGMTHTKSLTIDAVWSVVGSTNLDNRSFGLNDEVNVAVLDPQVAAALRQQFEQDLSHSHLVNYEQWKRRPVWERVVEFFGMLLERQQ